MKLVFEPCNMKPPRGSFRGELIDDLHNHLGFVYLINGRGVIGKPREFGRGELAERVPGDFDPRAFEKAGGLRVSAAQVVQYWRIREGGAL